MSDEKYYNLWGVNFNEIKEGTYYIYKDTIIDIWFLLSSYCSSIWCDRNIQIYYYSSNKIDKVIRSCDGKSKLIPNEYKDGLYYEKYGMTISIDEDYKITHKLVKLNNEFFKLNDDYKTPIDISLLKPVREWDD